MKLGNLPLLKIMNRQITIEEEMMRECKTICVSPNGRYLQLSDGQPFFYLADTAWELFHRLTFEEIEFYLDTRQRQGFNTIQSVLISENDGLHIPNAYGNLPLIGANPENPDPVYFKFIDTVLKLAEAREMYFAIVPVWGDKIDKVFGIGPEIFDEANAYSYGKWLGNRYKHYPNIIWMNGGDRSGGGKNFAVWDALGKGIKSEDPNHPMTFHPLGDASSSMWFHDADWLDFNSCQSGHSMRNYPNYMMISYDYLRNPAKPCIDSEPRYEEHAVNWKPELNGFFDDYDIRQAAYWSVFSGACGHTYGTHPVWQMYDKGREAIGYVRYNWKEALHLKGATQLIHLKNLILSRPYFERLPDQSLLISPKVGEDHICCTRGNGFIFCYLPDGGMIELNTSKLKENQFIGWWYDPRSGETTPTGLFNNQGKHILTSPSKGRGCDWVLVLDDPSCKYGKPGVLG
jgi:hypothetical protein